MSLHERADQGGKQSHAKNASYALTAIVVVLTDALGRSYTFMLKGIIDLTINSLDRDLSALMIQAQKIATF